MMLMSTDDPLVGAAAAGIHCLTLRTPLPVGDVNAFLVDGDPVTLIDCGPRESVTRVALEQGLHAIGRSLEEVELLLLTHQHLDHHGMAGELVHELGVQTACLDPLASYLEGWRECCAADEEHRAARMTRHGASEPVVSTFRTRVASRVASADPVKIDRRLAHGDVVDLGRVRLRVMHRPGHSPTDTLFWDEQSGVAVVGDHLLLNISSNPLVALGVNASPGFRPLCEYRTSLALTREAPFQLCLTGHGPPVADHVALIDRRLAEQRHRSARVVEAVRSDSGRTAWEVALALFGSEVTEKVPMLCFSEAIAHLELLQTEGRVVREESDPVRFLAV